MDQRLEAIRTHLLDVREKLLLDVRQRKSDAVTLRADGVADPGDEGLMDDLSDLLHQLSDAEHRQIVEIDEALDRLEQGVYGTCEGCGEPIEIERLEALPFARYCVECKEAAEAADVGKRDPRRGKI